MSGPVHVAVGLITASDGRILIARRPETAHQGGCWEFPGGKVEPLEGVRDALTRELHEELGIDVVSALPALRIPHEYPDKSVLLDVWRVTAFCGQPRGREGQCIRWVSVAELPDYNFPEANGPIVRAASLPDTYLITADPIADIPVFLAALTDKLEAGVRLLQLRAHSLEQAPYARLATQVAELCRRHGAQLMLNGSAALAQELGVGLHVTSHALAALRNRPVPSELPLAASCHTPAELEMAVRVGADFAVLGPVQETTSHPRASPLGLALFKAWIRDVPLPVYALGGMSRAHLPAVLAARGQGVAGISGF